ncbi:MAG: hypothetical protein Q8M07_25465 [Prosthecobacter sp.]|nr:hypothetical protein [Prosthecobacter sp.]
MLLSLIASIALHAQDTTSAKVPAPAELLGKTFEQCETMLGKPVRSEDPEGKRRSFERYYKPAAPGIVQIKLQRLPVGSMTGNVSETVNAVRYYFPKGSLKTAGDCFALVGVSLEGASHSSAPFKAVAAADALPDAKGMNFDVAEGLWAYWEPTASSLTKPAEFHHADEDAMSFMKRRGPTMKERQEKEKKAKAAATADKPAN